MSLRAKLLYAAGSIYWQIFRPVTLGVRLILVRENRVALVKHSYQREWFLPGGGVRRKETLKDAARREAWEEVGARVGELSLFGVYTNLSEPKSDHVAVFVCRDFAIVGTSDFEIERCEFFPFDDLPGGISPGSARRILEYRAGEDRPVAANW